MENVGLKLFTDVLKRGEFEELKSENCCFLVDEPNSLWSLIIDETD